MKSIAFVTSSLLLSFIIGQNVALSSEYQEGKSKKPTQAHMLRHVEKINNTDDRYKFTQNDPQYLIKKGVSSNLQQDFPKASKNDTLNVGNKFSKDIHQNL